LLAEKTAETFADYVASGIPQASYGVSRVHTHHKIYDLECEAGHLVYALTKLGYDGIAAMASTVHEARKSDGAFHKPLRS
jgi:hypothetical protein